MQPLFKKLTIAATATALVGAIGASFAQTETDRHSDAMSESQQVDVQGSPSGQQIYFFRDQGNSPETDPAAHLMLIKHRPMVPVAERTTTTTVAQATTPADTATVMPGPADTSNTESSADTTMTQVAAADESPALPPKADRN